MVASERAEEEYLRKMEQKEEQAELVGEMQEALSEWDFLDVEFRKIPGLKTYKGRVDMLGRAERKHIPAFLSAAWSKLHSYCVERASDLVLMQKYLS